MKPIASQMPSIVPTKIAFVVDFPVDEDVVMGQHLAGAAGRVFNAMLRNANLDRDEYYIGSVFNEQPDNDDPAEWLRDPVRVSENLDRLNKELLEVQPTVIVPLGAVALWAFTEEKLIGKFRGAVTKATRVMPGHKLVPTYHPQAVRKNWAWLVMVVKDLVKAAEEAELGPEIIYPKVELLIEPNLAEIAQFVPECVASPKLSVDIETGWGQITAIAFAPTTSRAMSIPFVDLRRPNKSYWVNPEQEVRAWRYVEEILAAPNPKVGQNYMYDIFWLYLQKGIATRNYRSDTRLRHKVLYPELQADLATMAASYTRVGSYKTWGGRYQKNDTKKDG